METQNGQHTLEKATVGGGCFWCLEPVFGELEGVKKVVSGYAGGHVENPSYREVCSGRTGHAEVVQITFDPGVISFRDLLDVFFVMHDPTTLNQQGPDKGTQYRSAIFYESEAQKDAANTAIADVEAGDLWDDSVVTEVEPLEAFYAADEYHQNYYEKNPSAGYCQVMIRPKVAKARKRFAEKLKA